MDFMDALRNRRSIYALGKNTELSDLEIQALITEAMRLSPSSFNSQSSRAVILMNDFHNKFWEIVTQTLKKMVSEDAFASTQKRMNGFMAGKGTVLFYEDQTVITDLQEKYPLYAENFPIWSEHSTAMAQLAVWTVLSEHHIGASLQHYNPIADAEVAQEFQVPITWKLRAQLVFGSIEGDAYPKEMMKDEDRFKILA